MKKMILFTAALLLIGTAAQATDHKHVDQQDRVITSYRHAQQITFIEGGVKFFVNTNGEIDFRILNRRIRYRQASWYSDYNTPGAYGHRRSSHRMVRYDYHGRLKKVGPNYINYDRYNRVRRIGTINIRYNRQGLLSQIGGLHIYYKRYGSIKFVEGDIHYNGCGYCGIDGCTTTHNPYFDQSIQPYYRKFDHKGDRYENRKRKKRYHDDDDDDDDDDDYSD